MTPRQVDVQQIETFRMLRSRLHFVALTVLCAVATTSASSQEEQVRTDPLDRDRLSVGSGTEGAVRIVSTSDTVEVKGLLGEWHRLHPDIRTDYIHQSSLEVYEDVVKCRDQGQCADVAWSSAMDLQVKLVNDGYAHTKRPRSNPWLGNLEETGLRDYSRADRTRLQQAASPAGGCSAHTS